MAAAIVGPPASAAGLDCGPPPAAQAEADAALGKAITAPARDAASDKTLAEAIGRLQAAGLRKALIVDHAVAAYCPLVAREDGISLDRKQEDVRRFASDVTSMLYGSLDPSQAETAIILSLPVKPALSDRIAAAAAKAGQSRDAWIRGAIEAKLAGN
ncbi:hypothetical protein [Methylobacterium haplocladii]|nr:hypothetical protein [Methylobacterium haplocladii]